MGELLRKKAIDLRERIERLRAAVPSDPSAVRDDERLESYLAFQLFLAIQDAIDIAARIAAGRELGVATSHREAFEFLAKAKLISDSSAGAMGGMAALRNRIAHSCGDHPTRMAAELPRGLDTLSTYLDELATAIAAA